MADHKVFKTYEEQVDLLLSRGMTVEDRDRAVEQLRLINYYRLSGYWYPMRQFQEKRALDRFQEGASFDLVVNLYNFDERLRHSLLSELTKIELAIRAILGHELGRIDPLIHESLNDHSALARETVRNSAETNFTLWKKKFDKAVTSSREDFVKHHQHKYGGTLPIWAAVEVMDWGLLSHLYRLSPTKVKRTVADQVDLSAPQFESWMQTLNVLRNYAAHNARVFNRVFNIKPKLTNKEKLQIVDDNRSRLFGQASMVQYLLRRLELSDGTSLPAVFLDYPENGIVPFGRTGAPEYWATTDLWKIEGMKTG